MKPEVDFERLLLSTFGINKAKINMRLDVILQWKYLNYFSIFFFFCEKPVYDDGYYFLDETETFKD